VSDRKPTKTQARVLVAIRDGMLSYSPHRYVINRLSTVTGRGLWVQDTVSRSTWAAIEDAGWTQISCGRRTLTPSGVAALDRVNTLAAEIRSALSEGE
jgi:hypothetical protein